MLFSKQYIGTSCSVRISAAALDFQLLIQHPLPDDVAVPHASRCPQPTAGETLNSLET